jgi:hypothetical protein
MALLAVIIPEAGAAETGVDFSIRFYDRRIYYTDSDPIFIQVTITNNSPSTYRFKLADDRAFSLDFDVRTVSNRAVERADALIRKRTQYQRIFFREVAVEPGESFSFVEDLRDYAELNEPGAFVVKACVYPELLRSETVKTAAAGDQSRATLLESQRLSLNIRPPVVTGKDGLPVEMDTATGAVLAREQLAPDKVIEYMLTARQRSQWEKFFLYIDLEAMFIAQDPARYRRWLAESEEGRRRMINQFRQELRNSADDKSISVLSTEFVIQRTEYSGNEGTVTVLQKFRTNNFTELMQYTYSMRLKDGIWTIVNYSVVKQGTE